MDCANADTDRPLTVAVLGHAGIAPATTPLDVFVVDEPNVAE